MVGTDGALVRGMLYTVAFKGRVFLAELSTELRDDEARFRVTGITDAATGAWCPRAEHPALWDEVENGPGWGWQGNRAMSARLASWTAHNLADLRNQYRKCRDAAEHLGLRRETFCADVMAERRRMSGDATDPDGRDLTATEDAAMYVLAAARVFNRHFARGARIV